MRLSKPNEGAENILNRVINMLSNDYSCHMFYIFVDIELKLEEGRGVYYEDTIYDRIQALH